MTMKYVWMAVCVGIFAGLAHAGDMTIQTPVSNVRQGPSAGHTIVGTVNRGARVTPLRVEQNYLEVVFGENGRKGWLYFPAQGWTAEQVLGELKTPHTQQERPTLQQPGVPVTKVAKQMPPTKLPEAVDAGADMAWTSIAELGFRRGWMFEGLEPGHRQSFRFFLPRAAIIRSAKLRLGFTPIPGLGEHSILRVDVNGLPVYSTSLARAGGSQWLELPLSRAVLAAGDRGAVDVVVKASLIKSNNRCMDDRAITSFLHIDQATGLALDLAAGEDSVLSAWEMLPKHVTLSLPAKPDENTFASALVLMHQLHREGKTADIVRLPQFGDIVVAAADEVRSAAANHPAGIPATVAPAAEGNARILKLQDRRILVFSGQPTEWPAMLPNSGWMAVARSAAHEIKLAEPLHGRALPATLDEVSFDRLGADMSPRDVVRSAEWRVPLGVDRIPAGRTPTHMRLNVTSVPIPGAQPMILYAYLNEELQGVQHLNGGDEQFTLHFASSAVRGAFNQLRLVIQQDISEGNCQTRASGYPVQIARGSTIVFGADNRTPLDFGALPRHFATGYDLLLGREVLERPEAALIFLANLLNANQYPLEPKRIRFITDSKTPPAGPFLLLADESLGLSGTAVRFDRGRVLVNGHDGKPILDADRLNGVAVVQLANWGAQRGLWVKPPMASPLPATPTLGLTFDSVAFIDDKGVALTLSPDLRDVAKVDYPEYRNWFDLFGAYRYWLMALGWIIIVLILVKLYVKVRSHKRVS